MRNASSKTLGILPIAGAMDAAFAAGNPQDDSILGGVLVMLAVVVFAYALVFLVRALMRGSGRVPGRFRDMNAIEFDKLTRPLDSPTIDRY